MSFEILSKKVFETFSQKVAYKSFMQSSQMAELFKKRGYSIAYVGLRADGDLQVAALVYSMPMTGGLHMEINSGPFSTDTKYLSDFYRGLQDYAKNEGALELLVKPYDTYQTFDSDGNPIDDERPELIKTLTDLGFVHDGLQTGYPGGEPDWHYVKDMREITADNLMKSLSKKGRPLVKKSKTFGTKLKKLSREELALFKEITSSTSDRRDYTDKGLDYYQAFYDSWGDQAEFMIASLNFQDYADHLKDSQAKLQAKLDKLAQTHAKNLESSKYLRQKKELDQQVATFDKRLEEAQELLDHHGHQDVILAGSLFVYTKQEAIYLFSGSYTKFNKFYAPALLQEHVMLETIKRGIPSYNFLGIEGIFDGSDGVLRFKQNFNGYITRKMGTFRYYPSPLKFKALKTIKKVLGRQ
ncbi:aminoacyltransferase [Streptococcus sobrinus]|uniref:aminoacyltransferase n=2 Tax=Streptococcus sobrinus TaxID=1310 RepID=UPI0002D3617A|nr:aminoacyltransferase [Streptococcus sobrinus]